MAMKPADRNAEAPINKPALIREAIKQSIDKQKVASRNSIPYPKELSLFETGRRRQADLLISALRIERNEHEQNFALLLHLVSKMANHGSVDCEQVISEFYDEYIASF